MKDEKIKKAIIELNELEKLLTERIVELANYEGFNVKQSRHAYIYYRSFIWRAIENLKN